LVRKGLERKKARKERKERKEGKEPHRLTMGAGVVSIFSVRTEDV
jgi:hypothetical protein